jgi:hypothetical protein
MANGRWRIFFPRQPSEFAYSAFSVVDSAFFDLDLSEIRTAAFLCAFSVRLSLGGGGRFLRLCVSLDSGPKNPT